MRLYSQVEGFEGACYPVWLNTNMISLRFSDSLGITGFFKLKNPPCEIIEKKFNFFKYTITISYSKEKNPEFHGAIVGNKVVSTKLKN